MGFELRLAMSTHSTMVLLVIVLQFSSLTLASSSPSVDQGMARAVSAQERKISRLEAKNAEQDLKIDQLSETIRHQQDVLQAWQASQKRILTTSLADMEERIARQEAKNAELDSFMNGIKQDCNLTSEKTPTGGDSVLLITGGDIGGEYTASTEVFPSRGCSSLPSLPLPRSGHQTFKTSDPTPLIATCGGDTGDYTLTASCLVVDLENQRWDESRMGSLTMPRYNGAVVELKQGVLFLGGEGSPAETTSDFLATGSLQWQQGPRLPQAMAGFCAVPVTESRFITIYDDKIHEFDAAIAGPTSEEGWRDSTLWPTLETSRDWTTGCAKIANNKVIVAGGFGGGRYLQSTTVLDITTRTISTGGDMATPRAWFNLATISRGGGDTTFAIAGTSSGGSERLNSVEEWEEESSTWKAAGNLDTARIMFSVVTIPKNIICPT